MDDKKIIWITGASSGIGKALAIKFAENGWIVAASARREILLNELKQYNPELMDKERILAITKCDMLDDELIAELSNEFPIDVKVVCISSVANIGIIALKDLIWSKINK